MLAPAKTPSDRMMLTARRLALVAGLSLPLTFAAASYAQPTPAGRQGVLPVAALQENPEKRAAAISAHMWALLQLRPDQEPALTVFLASMRPAPGAMSRAMANPAAEMAIPAPERMERMMARVDVVRAEMGRKLEALKVFYGQLTPSQQKAFDALSTGRRHRIHRGGRDIHPG